MIYLTPHPPSLPTQTIKLFALEKGETEIVTLKVPLPSEVRGNQGRGKGLGKKYYAKSTL